MQKWKRYYADKKTTKMNSLYKTISILHALSAMAALSNGDIFDAEERVIITRLVNDIRDAAINKAKINYVTYDVTASLNIDPMASTCTMRPTKNLPVGETETVLMVPSGDPADVIMAIYSEKRHYNRRTKRCDEGRYCENYLQLMNPFTYAIGCARSACGRTFLLICRFREAEGKHKEIPAGPPCSACTVPPFCVRRKCTSKNYLFKMKPVYPDITGKELVCKKICRNCGTLDPKSCKCLCADVVGGDCETKKNDNCSPCGYPSICLNGGSGDTSDLVRCKCKCPKGYLGDRCQFTKQELENSVTLQLCPFKELKVFGSNRFRYLPPVPVSLFEFEIWPVLRSELAKAVNAFCRTNNDSFAMCCPGESYPGAAKLAGKNHVIDADVKFNENSVENIEEDLLQVFVHATISKSDLCSKPGAVFVPTSTLISAIRKSWFDIYFMMSIRSDGIVLRSYKKAFVPQAEADRADAASNSSQIPDVDNRRISLSTPAPESAPQPSPERPVRRKRKGTSRKKSVFVVDDSDVAGFVSSSWWTAPLTVACHVTLNLTLYWIFW